MQLEKGSAFLVERLQQWIILQKWFVAYIIQKSTAEYYDSLYSSTRSEWKVMKVEYLLNIFPA